MPHQLNFLHDAFPILRQRNRPSLHLRHFIIGAPLEHAAILLFLEAAPLLEEERDFRHLALITDRENHCS